MFSLIRTSPRKGKEPAERNFKLTASKSASRKLSIPAVVLEELSNESLNELSNEMVPDLPDCSLKVEDETQTALTDQEAYLTTISRRFLNSNRKLRNLSANCKIPSGNVMLLIKDCLTLKTVSQKIPMLLFKLAFKGGTL